VRWVRPETFHVTLRFLGDVEVSRIAALARQVVERTAEIRPFALRLGGARAFPSPRRPRVVVLDLAPAAPLEALAAAVEGGVVAAGFEPESRPFRPHLTLGRVRGAGERLPRELPSPDGAEFDVTEAVLFRSELRPGGALHTPLERFSLHHPLH
jgi:2'-5' RNA ligase